MQTARLLACALFSTLASYAFVACSSSSNGALKPAGHDGGTGDATTGDANGGSSSGGTSSGGGADAHGDTGTPPPAPDCGIAPTLPPQDAGDDAEGGDDEAGLPPGTIYCATTQGGVLTCKTGDQCCLGGLVNGSPAPDECAVFGAPCLNGTGDAGASAAGPVRCDRISDCQANGLTGATACCLRGAQSEQGCSYPLFTGGGTIECEGADLDGGLPADAGATACKLGETQVCQTNDDCTAGTKCVAATWRGRPMGVCK